MRHGLRCRFRILLVAGEYDGTLWNRILVPLCDHSMSRLLRNSAFPLFRLVKIRS